MSDYLIDTESLKYNQKNNLLDINNFKKQISNEWMWGEPFYDENNIQIYKGHSLSSGKNGLIIMIHNKNIIIQVDDKTNLRNILHIGFELEMKMSFFSGWVEDNDRMFYTQKIKKNSIEILFPNMFLIILFNSDDENDIKIFVDEFDYDSSYDFINSRYIYRESKCISDPESSDGYNEQVCLSCTIESTQVESSFYETNNDDTYIRSNKIIQILKQGTNLILVIKEYNIEFNDTYQFYHEEKLSQNKIYFLLPISKNFIFTPLKNNIQLINESADTYTFIITYNDSNNKKFYMTLQIKKDFSKELSVDDTYEDSFYIYRNCNSKFSIHNNKFVKSAPTWKELIGIIDFDQEDDEIYQNNFMKAHVK
jgi:hypothetical protein